MDELYLKNDILKKIKNNIPINIIKDIYLNQIKLWFKDHKINSNYQILLKIRKIKYKKKIPENIQKSIGSSSQKNYLLLNFKKYYIFI